jgi:D-sedoheptulose 7-phosphate isomerase
MPLTASEYFHKLSELMFGIEVTEKGGAPLPLDEGAEKAVQRLLSVGSSRGKIMLVGNGGSAAIVSHVQNDLCKAVGFRALVFTEQPLLTALANDNGYGSVYEFPVEQWAEAGDLLWAVSSSGNSENILRAAQAASDRGCIIMTLTGFSPDNRLRQMGDLNFYVASDVYGYVETAHAGLSHMITDRARSTVDAASKAKATV